MWWPRPLLPSPGCACGARLERLRLPAPLRHDRRWLSSGRGDVGGGGRADPRPCRAARAQRAIFENTGGGAAAPRSNYKLDIVIKESVINELVKISGDAKGQVYELDATFKLIGRDGKVLLEGKATSRAAYERFETIFSNVRARVDAENRAARTVAESIKVRIAAFLSQAA